MNGYKIYTSYDGTDKQANIAFQSGKGTCVCGFHKDGTSEFYVWGKFSDMVRVYSALRNNGYQLRAEIDKDEK